jgi:hypothetical protein
LQFHYLFQSLTKVLFHRSLTVLLRYRSPEVLAPWSVVAPASRPVPRAGRYSPNAPPPARPCRVRASHPLRGAVPGASARDRSLGGLPHAGPRAGTTPRQRRACAHSAGGVWAAAGSARRYSRPRACFFLLGLLRCFTSPACPHPPSGGGDAAHHRAGFPHSGTVGSPPARGLPHALGPSRPPFLGLRRPGHPPGALSNAGHAPRAPR